jgi:hypothetical protein
MEIFSGTKLLRARWDFGPDWASWREARQARQAVEAVEVMEDANSPDKAEGHGQAWQQFQKDSRGKLRGAEYPYRKNPD